jgi:hypothetical protein
MSMNPIRLNHIAFSYTGKMLSGIEFSPTELTHAPPFPSTADSIGKSHQLIPTIYPESTNRLAAVPLRD